MKPISLALALLLACLFLSQGATAPFEKDEESRPAGVIADLVQRGAWLLPADSYGQVTRKPPLYYWLSAALLKLRNAPLDEAGARAVSIISGAALAAVVLGVAGAAFGPAAGWLAWLMLLGCYGFVAHAAYARTDMLFTLLMFAGYCSLYPALEQGAGARSWVPAAILLGLAILTKGPLGLVLCALAIFIYLLWTHRNPLAPLGRPWPWLTIALALAIAALWYGPAFIATHGQLLKIQFGQENLGHLLPRRMGGTGEAARPVYYILARFIGAALPLCLYIPALILALGQPGRAPRQILYQLSFLLAVLGLFTLASAKRDDYVLPAFPPFAIALGWLAVKVDFKPAAAMRELATRVAALALILAVTVAIVLALAPAIAVRIGAHLQSSDSRYLALFMSHLEQWHEIVCLSGLLIGAIAALAASRTSTARIGIAAIAIASMAGVSLWVGAIRPGLAQRRTFKFFALRMRKITGGAPVYAVTAPDYEISFYYGRPLPALAAMAAADKPNPRYILVWSNTPQRRIAATGREEILLTSHWTSDQRRLELLKIAAGGFEPGQVGK
jgi:4-amino-4-deoxy-L-arabinose transferase-like glycosyltransferase